MGKFFLMAALLFSLAGYAQDVVVVPDSVVAAPAAVDEPETTSTYSESPFLPHGEVEPVKARALPEGQLDQLKSSDDYWYANLEPKKKEPAKPRVKNGLFDQPWFSTLFWIIVIGGLIGAIVWYLSSINIGLFRRQPQQVLATDEEAEPEDIFETPFAREIAKAEAAENYRLAVRLRYLSTIKELSTRNLITYSPHKTNSAYLLQLFGGRYYHSFFRLTRNFEYTWYGQFPLTAEGYQLMATDFTEFKNGLA